MKAPVVSLLKILRTVLAEVRALPRSLLVLVVLVLLLVVVLFADDFRRLWRWVRFRSREP